MKIIYCIQSTCHSGGMERVLSNKVNYLANLANYEVLIITSDQRGRPHFYEISPKVKCIDLGINYDETNEINPIVKIVKSVHKYSSHKRRLKELLFRLKADVVVSMFTNDVNFLYGINDGSKKVLEIHFSREFRLLANRNGIMRLIDLYITYFNDRIVKKYDRFVVLTNEDKLCWKNQNNISVIYNSIAKNGASNVSLLENRKALAVGRVTHQKNLELLVELWAEISKKHADWNLTIVGTGNSTALQEKIKDMSLEDVVTVLPSTNSINEYYIDSSLYLMTSRYEGLPMVLLEAQNFGLPIVSFDCKCGPKEIINDGEDGFLIANGDNGAFIDKVSQLIENENLRIDFGKKAKKNSTKFSEETIMQQWVLLFEEMVKE
jgi:glycosyltransferase involved in cell wall biosynthesis